jgi:hypothetical protein
VIARRGPAVDDGTEAATVYMHPGSVHSVPRAASARLEGIPARPAAIAREPNFDGPQIHAPCFYYE